MSSPRSNRIATRRDGTYELDRQRDAFANKKRILPLSLSPCQTMPSWLEAHADAEAEGDSAVSNY